MITRWLWLSALVGLAGLLLARDAAAANLVARVDVEQSGPRRTVRIATTEAPLFATYQLEASREVVVDIATGDLRQVAGPLQVRDGVLKDVTFQQFQTGPLLISRITLGLAVRCSTTVTADGNSIVVQACNGATDIPAEPLLLASTDTGGMEAFTLLAQQAVTMAVAEPAFLAPEIPAPPAASRPRRGGRAARVASSSRAHRSGRAPGKRAARIAAAAARAERGRAKRARTTLARAATGRAAGHVERLASDAAAAERPLTRRERAALAAERRTAALVAKNATVLDRARARFARRVAARTARRKPMAVAAARPRSARKGGTARHDASAGYTARRARAVAFNLEQEPMVIEGRRTTQQREGTDAYAMAAQGRFIGEALPEHEVDRRGAIVIRGRRAADDEAMDEGDPSRHAASLVAVQRVDHHRILLRVKGNGRFKSRHLADPPRFVVDLGGIRRDTVEKLFALDTDQRASRVRLGDQDFGVRAVFDLRDHHTRARVRRTKDGLLVAFSGRKPGSLTPTAGERLVVPAGPDTSIRPPVAPNAPRSEMPVLRPHAKSG